MLDTTFLIDFLEGDEELGERWSEIQSKRLFTTQLNVYELLFGIHAGEVSDRGERLESAEGFVNSLNVLDIDSGAVKKAAEVAGALKREGQMIDDVDSITAGVAISKGIETVVTRNSRHFERIDDLEVETY